MKSIEEVKARLEKLLAMAEEGSNASASEIQTAMVKARKLMAEYKLSNVDLTQIKKTSEIIQKRFSDIIFSTTVNPWINTLTSIIASNHCCKAVMYHSSGAKTRTAGMIGFEEDIELASTVLTYAVNCVLAEGKEIRKNAIHHGYSNADATSMINAYGNGWVRGIKEAFDEQNKIEHNTGFAMVMVEPPELNNYVKDHCVHKSFNTSKATHNARSFDSYAVKGFKDGKEFNMRTKLSQRD